MPRRLPVAAIVVALCLLPLGALAQIRVPPRPGTEASEIKLDETTGLKAAALEARMSAVLANFALLQRQAQDLQVEYTKMLEERKKLLEDAARRANVEVKDTTEWAFDYKGQRYLRATRTPAPPGAR